MPRSFMHHCLTLMLLFSSSACAAGPKDRNAQTAPDALAACKSSPNCVSSMDTRAKFNVPPLTYDVEMGVAYQRLMDVLKEHRNATIVTRTERYIHAAFTTSVLRFVDDVEFLFDPTSQQIHIRSASRTGYYDFGVNARRVARLRTQFNAREASR